MYFERIKMAISCAFLLFMLAANAASAQTIPGKPANKWACINITSYGAKSNGADATQAIQNAIDAARARTEKCVYIPTGTFNKGRLRLDGVKLIGDGPGSVLRGGNPGNHQQKVAGSGAGLYDLKLFTVATYRTDDNDAAVFIDMRSNSWVIDNVIIDGANGPGIINYGGYNGRITRNQVLNSKSDGIHNSGGAYNLYIAGNKVRNSGDDMIAVVTYQYQADIAREVLIENNDLADQSWGRGISVVGGEKVTIRNNKIRSSADAGIYLAAETSWQTKGVNNVLVSNNTIDRAPQAYIWHGHSSILAFGDIYDNRYAIQYLAIRNNIITNAPNGAARINVVRGWNIGCQGNTLNGAAITVSNCQGNTGSVTGATITSSLLGGGTVGLPL